MIVTSDAPGTSVSTYPRDLFSLLYGVSTEYVGMSDVSPIVVASRRAGSTVATDTGPQMSGKRRGYMAFMRINSPAITSVINASFGRVRYTCYGNEFEEPFYFESVLPRLTRTSEEIEGIPIEGWSTDYSSVAEDEFRNTLSSLRALIRTIESGSPVRLAPEVENLIEGATRSHGTPDNIDRWARRLAEDIRGVSD